MEEAEGSWQQLPAGISITAAILRRHHRGDHDHAQPGSRFPASAHHRHRRRAAVRSRRRSRVARQIAGPNRMLVTSALVGTAGSFVGYHLALLIGIVGYGALLVAVIGALAVLWGWRTVR